MKKLFLILICILSISSASFADSTTISDATNIVNAWLSKNSSPLGVHLSNTISDVETYFDADNSPVYYIVSLSGGGYVIVSADDMLEPILAFSATGTFDYSSSNPLADLIQNDLSNRFSEIKQFNTGALLYAASAQDRYYSAKQKWNKLSGSSALEVKTLSDPRIDPIIKSKWDQSDINGYAVYNYYTPKFATGSKDNYVCGCVATALAQLMRFYEYPTIGVGTGQFPIKIDGKIQYRNLRGGDGIGGPYPWANMPLEPDMGIVLAQRQAIGALCYDAGVAVNMSYKYGGSSAYISDAAIALRTTFKYGNAIISPEISNTNSLNNLLNSNLDAGCPVLMTVFCNNSSGHAVVCDGYGYDYSTLYHHLNMGWSGSDDAWYNLPDIDTSNYNYNVVSNLAYNIYPQGSGEIISGRVLDDDGNPVEGAFVESSSSQQDTTDSRGIYALSKVPGNTSLTLTVQKSGYSSGSRSVATGNSVDYDENSGNLWNVNFQVEKQSMVQSIVTDKTKISVPESGSAVFRVKLTKAPEADLVVNVACTSGDPDITTGNSGLLTFNQSNWNIYQSVTLNAAADLDADDSTSEITCYADGVPAVIVTATEIDKEPYVTLSLPSLTETSAEPVTYIATYSGAANINLTAQDIQIIKTGTADALVEVSGTGDTREITLNGFTGDGTIAIKIKAGSGNAANGKDVPASLQSESFDVHVPLVAVVITMPTTNSEIDVFNNRINISGTAISSVKKLVWSNDLTAKRGICKGKQIWSASKILLKLGVNNITVSASDKYNVIGTKVLSVRYTDITPPVIKLKGAYAKGYYNTKKTYVVITGSSSDIEGVSQVAWHNIATDQAGVCIAKKSWKTSKIPIITGENKITITAQDSSGNASEVSVIVNKH